MRVEVVAVGTELLLGQITDTNSSWMGEQLALEGFDSYFQVKVGDNLDRIVETLRIALDRSDAVICSGGLGPTQDDLTRSAIAAVMGVPLEEDEEMAERIIAMFSGRGSGRRMSMNNLQQAQRPQGSDFLDEMPGTAPGLRCELQWPIGGVEGETTTKVIYAVPGVPWEMKEMFSGSIITDLRKRGGLSSVIRSRTLRTWGETESGLAELLADRISALDGAGNPTLAFLASGAEGLKVRITAKADDNDAVDALLAREETHLRELLGPLVFGVDDETMEFTVVELLRSLQLTIAVAESLTGGMIGSRLCEPEGASDVFLGGVISYATEVKRDLLKVEAESVVTTEAAIQMARGVRELLSADVGISATGVAGPASLEGRPPGTVCLGVSIAAGAVGNDSAVEQAIEVMLPGRRPQVREFSVITLLSLLRRTLLEAQEAR